jgi:hypothetical protein
VWYLAWMVVEQEKSKNSKVKSKKRQYPREYCLFIFDF